MLALPSLLHGFSTRRGGVSTIYSKAGRTEDLNLGFTEADDAANVAVNRKLFLKAVTGDPDFPLITVRQVHSAVVRQITPEITGISNGSEPADGMMTAEPGILLGIQTADCIPVLIADQRRQVVAAFHAGWRGTLKRIVEEGVGQMRLKFGSKAGDLVAAIGPGIGPCCYRVGEEIRGEFEAEFSYAAELFREMAAAAGGSNDRPALHLDLVQANRRQLLDAGLVASQISIVGECTSCRTDRYFSYRAEGGRTGRMLSVIGIKPA
jgi:YfiH family protein